MNIKTTAYSLLAVLFLISCDEDTSVLGGSLTPNGDVITVKADSCFATSATIKATDSLLVMTSQCNIGSFTEQAGGAAIKAGFLTQIGCMENFSIADSVWGIGDHTFPDWFIHQVGAQKPYYANLKLYYTGYFGDSLNTVKIDVYPLEKMIETNAKYYANVNPASFCNLQAEPLASITVSAHNMQHTDSIRNSGGFYPSISIPLPDSLARRILESYYDPQTSHFFANSSSFMENLVKGFWICCSAGDGTIFYIDRTILEVNFKCIGVDSNDEPIMESLIAEFPGNSEVVQVNSIQWTGLERELSDSSCTWIRSPFGLLTEITLPIDDMRDDEYILNSAQLRISSAATPSSPYKPSVPANLLLIRKEMAERFFAHNSTDDGVESYISQYSTKYGTYTYDNIAALVEKAYDDRSEWLLKNGLAQDETGFAAYSVAYPDWNKVLLIPVTPALSTTGSVVSYSLDMRMHQVKLIGGKNHKLKIKTIRSKF